MVLIFNNEYCPNNATIHIDENTRQHLKGKNITEQSSENERIAFLEDVLPVSCYELLEHGYIAWSVFVEGGLAFLTIKGLTRVYYFHIDDNGVMKVGNYQDSINNVIEKL